MIDCVHSPGPPLRLSPAWQNGWAFARSHIQMLREQMLRESQFGCLINNQHDNFFSNSLAHPQFVRTSLPPAGTTGLFLLSGDCANVMPD
jgi:hypothetical protein